MNFEKILQPVFERLRLIVGRCVIKAVSYSSKEQNAEIELIAGEKRRNVQFIQQYGFSSCPKGDVSGIAVFIGGRRDNGAVIASNGDDISSSLSPGEVMVHSPFGQKIFLKEDGSIEVSANSGKKIVFKNEIECEREISAMTITPASKVTLSKHVHNTAVGPSRVPTPGI